MRRLGITLAAALGLTLTPVVPGGTTPVVTAAASDVVALVVEGTGYGHGQGMSQWGAYGWAVHYGWAWTDILDHYYGGTVLGDVDSAQTRIRVQLKAWDGANVVGVTAASGGVTWNGQSAPAMYAQEIAANTFAVYKSSTAVCPSASSLTVPTGPISRGSSAAAAVRQIQTFLNAFWTGGGSPLAVDGAFGSMTEARLIEWQRSRLLSADGVWNSDDAAEARALIAGASAASWSWLANVSGPVVFATPQGDNSTIPASSALGLCNSAGQVAHYRGKIEFRSESTTNVVVNDVKTEDYLRGVVPKEISPSWGDAQGGRGLNALMAQAVAARSYALERVGRTGSICDTTSCQVYFGADVEDGRTDWAITATAGKIRKWPATGAVVSTEFSASNGPRTAGGAFPAVDDALGDSTPSNPNHKWTRVLDADVVAAKYGVGTLTAAGMLEAASASNQRYDGIWFNDVVLNGWKRVEAWTFRGDFGLPSPGFTVRVVTRDTTAKTFAMIGDSVGNSIAGSFSSEFVTLTDGMFASSTIDVRDGRCTAHRCVAGDPLSNGAEIAVALPMDLDLVVVELGYNQVSSAGFAADIDSLMRSLENRRVKRVAWVNLATAPGIAPYASLYAARNNDLQSATSRWPNLTILDWATASNTPERSRWFKDHAHLSDTGQAQFAVWLRGALSALAPPPTRLAPPKRLEIQVVGEQVLGPDGALTTIPADATAVSVNATAVSPSGDGFMSVWPCGQPRPVASSLNFGRGEIVSNGLIAPVGTDGKICVYSHWDTDVIVDVTGWFGPLDAAGAGLTPITPYRVADSRDGTGMARGRVQPQSPVALQVTGLNVNRPNGEVVTVPANATAVAFNVVAVEPTQDGFISIWPCGAPKPTASTLNFAAGTIRANGGIAPLGPGGTLCVYAHQPTDIVLDIVGWITPNPVLESSAFVASGPDRFVDTRIGLGAPWRPVAAGWPLVLGVTGRAVTVGGRWVSIPADAEAVAVNVIAVGPSRDGFTTMWPCGAPLPRASSINYAAGTITANNAIVPIGQNGTICLYSHSDTHVVVDVTGWFNASGVFTGVIPDRFVDTRYGIGPIPV